MTNEEAKSNLEKLLQLYDDGMIDFSIIRESIKVAIEALEKQIPKKPTLHEGWLYCSVCRKDILMEGYKFCPDCGQRIEWEDEG